MTTMDANGTPVGMFTLCQVCHYAIVVVRSTWADHDTGEQRWWDHWVHVAKQGIPHDAEPMPSVLDVAACPYCGRTAYWGVCSCGHTVQVDPGLGVWPMRTAQPKEQYL